MDDSDPGKHPPQYLPILRIGLFCIVLVLAPWLFSAKWGDIISESISQWWGLAGYTVLFISNIVATCIEHRISKKTWQELWPSVWAYVHSPVVYVHAACAFLLFLGTVAYTIHHKLEIFESDVKKEQKLSSQKAKERSNPLATKSDLDEIRKEAAARDGQKKFDKLFWQGMATNQDTVRFEISSQMPEPAKLPIMPGRFDLATLRRETKTEDERNQVAQTLATRDATVAATINAANAKRAAEIAEARSAERLRICNHLVTNFLSYLEAAAREVGDSVSTSNAHDLKRSFPLLYPRTSPRFGNPNPPKLPPILPAYDMIGTAQMAGNTNWSFAFALDSTRDAVPGYLDPPAHPGGDHLIIAFNRDAIIRPDPRGLLRLTNGAIGLEILLKEDFANFGTIGWELPSGIKPRNPIREWPAYEYLLQMFIGKLDRLHPLKPQK